MPCHWFKCAATYRACQYERDHTVITPAVTKSEIMWPHSFTLVEVPHFNTFSICVQTGGPFLRRLLYIHKGIRSFECWRLNGRMNCKHQNTKYLRLWKIMRETTAGWSKSKVYISNRHYTRYVQCAQKVRRRPPEREAPYSCNCSKCPALYGE